MIRLIVLAAGILGVGVTDAHAEPELSLNRKPGLWVVEISTDGRKTKGDSKQCIDATTDQQMLRMAFDTGSQSCSKRELTKTATGYVLHAECSMLGSSMVSRGEFVGDFDSKYTGEIRTTFNPPLYGRSSSRTAITARWSGACPRDMKPGDMTLPNGKRIDLAQAQMGIQMAQEAMSNPALGRMIQGAVENMPALKEALRGAMR
jgi:hypothetical protein